MRGRGFIQMWPPEGTSLRAVWDKLQANKGEFVDVSDVVITKIRSASGKYYPNYAHIRMQLTNFWGLDIAYKPHGMWCLVGEWKGKDYIDYLAERHK
jgi:hypothetical protein